MNTINLKDQIAQAIKTEWPAFERDHPRLAAVLDQTLLIEQAAKSLADDPDYQSAMQSATGMGLEANTVYATIADFVKTWISKLI